MLLLSWSRLAAAGSPSACAELGSNLRSLEDSCSGSDLCRRILSVLDTCVETKAWLDHLAPASPSGVVTNDGVKSAADSMSFVEMYPERPEDPSFLDCLALNRELCRQALGLDPIPIHVNGPPPKRSADVERKARMLDLYRESSQARSREAGPWRSAADALSACEQARTFGTRTAVCDRAQQQVDVCNTARAAWGTRKSALLDDVAKITPSVGAAYTPGISPLRGLGPQATSDELWNDTVRGLKTLDIDSCPTTLPSSFMTPAQALARWAAEEAAVATQIAACDTMSRDTFEAIDEGLLDKATTLADAFEARCSTLASSYATRAQLARSQIAAIRSAVSMPPRSTGYGTSLFQSAVQQANAEALDPAARQARLQAERDAVEDQIAREAASGGDGSSFANSMLNVMQVTAALQNARNGARMPMIPTPPVAQYQAPPQATYQAPPPTQLRDPGFQGSNQVTYRVAPLTAQQVAQDRARYLAEGQARMDAAKAEADRLIAASKFYPPLSCANIVAQPPGSIFTHCLRNNCGILVSAATSAGMVTAAPGSCAPVSGAPTMFGTCKGYDFFDSARQQCKAP